MSQEPLAGAGQPAPAKLDDLMMAMDVVDTLRHRDRLVERELNEEAREEQLISRLRAL
jgi:heme exporter protein D